MKKTPALIAALAATIGLTSGVQALAQDQTTHKLTKLWETEATLKVPESVRLDAKRKVLYVSNIDGQPWEADGKGSIAKVGLDGKVIAAEWVTGLNCPKGLALSDNGKWLYAVQELANEVVAFKWDAKKGVLTQFQQVKTLPADFTEQSTAAEIAVRQDGKFLYTTNRGHDSVVVYSIDAHSGELALQQRVPSRGKVPRYFTFDPSNKWLIVSNQEGGNVSVFAIDAKSGELSPHGDPVAISRPMAVVFLR